MDFTTQKTMQIAQQLYEGVELEGEGSQGLVTYIRTDSTRTADEAIEAVRESRCSDTYGADYLPRSRTRTKPAKARRTRMKRFVRPI